MAVDLKLLKGYCDREKWKYKEGSDGLKLDWSHERPDGKPTEIIMLIHLKENGELFMLECGAIPPGEIDKIDDKERFFFNLLHLGWATPFGSVEIDKDGEIRFRVEIPLEDNTLTQRQFSRAVGAALQSTGIVRMLAEKAAGGEAPDEESGLPSDQLRIVVAGVIKAKMILLDPDASEADKQQARTILEKAKEILPQQMHGLVFSDDVPSSGGGRSGFQM